VGSPIFLEPGRKQLRTPPPPGRRSSAVNPPALRMRLLHCPTAAKTEGFGSYNRFGIELDLTI